MSIKVKQADGKYKYKCFYCNKLYDDPTQADKCRDENHDLIYIPMSKSDVSRLLQFIYLKNDDLLTPTMIESLKAGLKKV